MSHWFSNLDLVTAQFLFSGKLQADWDKMWNLGSSFSGNFGIWREMLLFQIQKLCVYGET